MQKGGTLGFSRLTCRVACVHSTNLNLKKGVWQLGRSRSPHRFSTLPVTDRIHCKHGPAITLRLRTFRICSCGRAKIKHFNGANFSAGTFARQQVVPSSTVQYKQNSKVLNLHASTTCTYVYLFPCLPSFRKLHAI